MLVQDQQRRVWEAMLAAEIRANYFADLSHTYRVRQRLATWVVLFLSSGAAATFLLSEGSGLVWLRPLLILSTAAVSLYSVVAQNQESAMNSVDLHARWNKLAKEYETLWENMYVEDAGELLLRLDERRVELSKAGTAFPNDEARMRKWQRHVVLHRTPATAA
jgi:hypothetical protein